MSDRRFCRCGARMLRIVYQAGGVKRVYWVCPNCGRQEDD